MTKLKQNKKSEWKAFLIQMSSLGMAFLFGWLLNITPDIYGQTEKINWVAGAEIGWIMGIFSCRYLQAKKLF